MIIGGDDFCGTACRPRCIGERYHFPLVDNFMAKHAQQSSAGSKLEHSNRTIVDFAVLC